MFCSKLKDLKITGECPFSLLTQSPSEEHEEECSEVQDASEARLPICKEVGEQDIVGSLPQRKTSRSRVYLHMLAESIHKLIFPEFERLCLALQRALAKHRAKGSRSQFLNLSLHGLYGSSLEKEDFEKILTEQASVSGAPVDLVKESLGEELFKICYEEDEHVLEVVGGTLKDFLNSFTTHLKQGSSDQVVEDDSKPKEASILCLEKDQDFLNVYYFFPKKVTSLILPGIIKAAAYVLYETEVKVRLTPAGFHCDGSEFINQPYLLYSVQVKNTSPHYLHVKPQSSVAIPASLFCKTFPFHFMFDKDMGVLQIGNGVKRLLNRRDFPGRPHFEEYFEILSPKNKLHI